jgi:16S rRNA (adenine1518-N6/adenine1519-N6)-dimethyltransferase
MNTDTSCETHPGFLPTPLTATSIRQLLDEHGIRLTKSLGQNFLHDGNQLRKIVAASGAGPGSRVLEIGPGLGPLTERLLATGARVLAVEMDRRVAAVLRGRLHLATRLEIVEADAVDWLAAGRTDLSDWILASNLPYSVGSVILVELALSSTPPTRMTATLQKEVADRIAARPRTEDYGLLTVLMAAQFEVRDRFNIPASCFVPAPDVESTCITLERRAAPLVSAALLQTYAAVAKLGFSQRRKMAAKLLRSRWPAASVAAAFAAAGVGPDARAETLSPLDFAELAVRLAAEGSAAS